MKLFVTGDTHGEIDVGKLNNTRWAAQNELTREDLLIILGDFGFIWTAPTATEKYWLKWFDDKPFRVAFLDGNHENHDRLRAFPCVEFQGGLAGPVSENIWHLRRGEVYSIAGKTVFVMGGALSIDKQYRTEGTTWWADEIPTESDMENARQNLAKVGHKVDIVLTHTLPKSTIEQIRLNPLKVDDPTSTMLEELRDSIEFKDWYAGHFHVDEDIGAFHILFYRVMRIA